MREKTDFAQRAQLQSQANKGMNEHWRIMNGSLKSDQQDKGELYAKAGIVEYWIVDIDHQLIHVH